MSEHTTTIIEDGDPDEIPVYCCSCSCGYAGVAWHVRPNAEQDAERHRRVLAMPDARATADPEQR